MKPFLGTSGADDGRSSGAIPFHTGIVCLNNTVLQNEELSGKLSATVEKKKKKTRKKRQKRDDFINLILFRFPFLCRCYTYF